MKTPSAPISVHTMKLVSKYNREQTSVGQCPARLNSPRFILSPSSNGLNLSLHFRLWLDRDDRAAHPSGKAKARSRRAEAATASITSGTGKCGRYELRRD